jgi:hypothetical protein
MPAESVHIIQDPKRALAAGEQRILKPWRDAMAFVGSGNNIRHRYDLLITIPAKLHTTHATLPAIPFG